MMHRPLSLLLCSLAFASVVPAQEHGELGRMWTFENPPLAYLEAEYGFKPTQEWLDTVRLASLRYGQGCSASFVSPKGLIMTNHHCLRGDITKVQGAADWLADGFVAAALEDEVQVPDLTVQQLVSMRDVTAEINEGVTDGDDDEAVEKKRKENEAKILAAAESASENLTAQVVQLFQGARYQLYLYKIYDDIRLVMAPHLQTAHFGGDPDNFTYPRYGIDFGFVRAYEDGEPADTAQQYFRWSQVGPQEGELVFVTGNPGSTSRLLTKAQFDYERDAVHARILEMLDNRIAILQGLVERAPQLEKRVRTTILSWQNGQKAYRGELGGLRDGDLMQRKEAAERAFRQRIADDPKLEEKYGHLWDELAEVAAAQTALDAPLNFQTGGGSPHVEKALAIVRAVRAASAGNPEAGDMAAFAQHMPVRMGLVTAEFVTDHLVRAARWLPANDPYIRLVLGGRTPEQGEEWLRSSRVEDGDFVASLLAGGISAVEASDDPAIRVARLLAPKIEANQAAAERLDARAAVLGSKIGLALFDAYGDAVSPDATFTLRFSDGRVKGYEYNGTLAPWRTSFYGLYGHNAEFDDHHPFDLPAIWKERMGDIDMQKSVDFVATVDSTGGNSGSPVINQQREIVGLLFDGNIESLPNEFVFDDDTGRSVCVHVHAILEALTKIYDADRIAAELTEAQ
ncbi:MAG: S46 family peptidase [Planctomycetes bacterium]|nr:S46 family peptidase [Planctomycetota bacterium]